MLLSLEYDLGLTGTSGLDATESYANGADAHQGRTCAHEGPAPCPVLLGDHLSRLDDGLVDHRGLLGRLREEFFVPFERDVHGSIADLLDGFRGDLLVWHVRAP